MAKNIAKLAESMESIIGKELKVLFLGLKGCMHYSAHYDDNEVMDVKRKFETRFSYYKKEYGLEFPELQKDYDENVLPEINKRLGIKD